MRNLPPIHELDRLPSPAPTPQSLTWHKGELWVGSRDLRRIYRLEPKSWTVLEEAEAPGTPWAAVSAGHDLWFTLGEGAEDDRYLRRYLLGEGFSNHRVACPELTGSYLSYDGTDLYLSQWYKQRILRLDTDGNITREIIVGAEISGHVFVDGSIYVLRGTEQGEGDWHIARLNLSGMSPQIEPLARVPFQCRSLACDGQHFWTNHREADRIIRFGF